MSKTTKTTKNTKEKYNGIVVGVLQNKMGKVLIMERIKKETGADNSKLTWVFPGGRLDGDENPEEAMVREFLGETGYSVKIKEVISERDHPQFGIHIMYFALDFAEFKTRPIEEVDEVSTIKWVEPTELKDYFTTDIDPKVALYLKIS